MSQNDNTMYEPEQELEPEQEQNQDKPKKSFKQKLKDSAQFVKEESDNRAIMVESMVSPRTVKILHMILHMVLCIVVLAIVMIDFVNVGSLATQPGVPEGVNLYSVVPIKAYALTFIRALLVIALAVYGIWGITNNQALHRVVCDVALIVLLAAALTTPQYLTDVYGQSIDTLACYAKYSDEQDVNEIMSATGPTQKPVRIGGTAAILTKDAEGHYTLMEVGRGEMPNPSVLPAACRRK